MKKYIVRYRGAAFVEADSPEEAAEKWEDGDFVYSEAPDPEVEEVDEFRITI